MPHMQHMSRQPSCLFPLRTLCSLEHLHTVCSILATLATRARMRAPALSRSDFVTPWTVACQDPMSLGFPRQEYWSKWPFPTWIPRSDLRIPR